MRDVKQQIIETEEDITLPQIDSLRSSSIHGDTDIVGIADRIKRTEIFKRTYHWQKVIPCRNCSNCVEYRKFRPDGLAVTVGFYCFLGEMQTEEDATCDYGHTRTNGRRRIVYDGENAPKGFEEGLAPVQMKRYFSKRERVKAAIEAEKKNYRGGTSSYQRADGDKGAIGSGQIPKGLGN